jgi:putative transposase
VPGLLHHVTQRGNGRQRTLFADAYYALYRELLAESLNAQGVDCWDWVLMPNHVHLILAPSDEDGLRRARRAYHWTYLHDVAQ